MSCISNIIGRLRAVLHPRGQQQHTEESRELERSDDRHIGLILDGDLVTGIEPEKDPKADD